MFIPAYYRNTDLEEIKAFIRKNSFATLISRGGDRPEATHIPLELVENGSDPAYLQGHISRANPQWKGFSEKESVLAIFSGPHSYVSSGWYNHVNVPTWNYIAVHVYGKIRIMQDDDLYRSLKTLVDRYEADSKKPVRMEELPADMIGKYMKGIVGFNIEIEKIDGKWKLSQNRDEEDYKNIIAELEKVNDINANLIAAEMKKRV